MYAQATDVQRVLQSTYSELMGLYPVANTSQTLSSSEVSSLRSGKGMPAIRVRNAQAYKSQNEGSMRAVIDGYTMIPVFSYIPNSKWDDINQHGCNYVDQCIQNQITDPKYYVANGNEVLPIVGYRLGEAYKWSKEKVKGMNYLDFYLLADGAVSEAFEGAPSRGNFSETD